MQDIYKKGKKTRQSRVALRCWALCHIVQPSALSYPGIAVPRICMASPQLGWAPAGCRGIRDCHVILPSPSLSVSIPSGGFCLRADSYPSAGLALSSWAGVLSPSAGFASSPLASVSTRSYAQGGGVPKGVENRQNATSVSLLCTREVVGPELGRNRITSHLRLAFAREGGGGGSNGVETG